MRNAVKTGTFLPVGLSMTHLLAVLVGLVVADGLASRAIIESGLGREGNPFLHGTQGANWVLIKLAGGLLATFILADIHKAKPRAAETCAIVYVALYTGIVFWNVAIMMFAR